MAGRRRRSVSHIVLIIPDHRHAEEEGVLARLRRGERIDHFETMRPTKDGRLVDVSITVLPIRDAAGRIVGASKVGRDITERRRQRSNGCDTENALYRSRCALM